MVFILIIWKILIDKDRKTLDPGGYPAGAERHRFGGNKPTRDTLERNFIGPNNLP